MNGKTTENQTITNMLIERWELTNAKLAALAQEVPEAKFETAPVTGVRTVGDVLRHVAFWNHYVADVARGNKADDSTNELPKKTCATKSQVIAALKRSASEAAIALREHRDGLDLEKAALAESFIEHVCEHYGQLVIYARWAEIVPPASRG